MTTERRVEANGIAFHLEEDGAGPPVLLLHGFPDSRRLWRRQLPALAAAGYRAIAPDLRGYGGTDRPERVEDYRMRVLVADVVGLLDALGLDRVALVGHDWGAGLAWRVAMAAPDRVERLAVVSVGHPQAGAAAGLPQRQLSWYMLWFLFPGVAERALPAGDWALYRQWAWAGASRAEDEDLDRQLTELSRPGALTAGLNWYRANIRPEHFAALDPGALSPPPVTCPVLGVWSSADPALGEEQMRRSGEFVSGPFRYARIDGVDHWVPVHAAEPLNALLIDFLATEYGTG